LSSRHSLLGVGESAGRSHRPRPGSTGSHPSSITRACGCNILVAFPRRCSLTGPPARRTGRARPRQSPAEDRHDGSFRHRLTAFVRGSGREQRRGRVVGDGRVVTARHPSQNPTAIEAGPCHRSPDFPPDTHPGRPSHMVESTRCPVDIVSPSGSTGTGRWMNPSASTDAGTVASRTISPSSCVAQDGGGPSTLSRPTALHHGTCVRLEPPSTAQPASDDPCAVNSGAPVPPAVKRRRDRFHLSAHSKRCSAAAAYWISFAVTLDKHNTERLQSGRELAPGGAGRGVKVADPAAHHQHFGCGRPRRRSRETPSNGCPAGVRQVLGEELGQSSTSRRLEPRLVARSPANQVLSADLVEPRRRVRLLVSGLHRGDLAALLQERSTSATRIPRNPCRYSQTSYRGRPPTTNRSPQEPSTSLQWSKPISPRVGGWRKQCASATFAQMFRVGAGGSGRVADG